MSRRLGRYLLHEPIASGGMATVYLGQLMSDVGLSRTVAIKRLHPQYASDPEFVAMFLDEARVATRIHHPHVVSTLDVVDVDGEVLIILELVRGESLSTILASGEKPSLRVTSGIMSAALAGLHAAHEACAEDGTLLDVVHRDVSPQNILVDRDGVARVLDFGVAKAVNRLQTTEEGQIKGKLSYMAPEQLMAGEIDRRADVFAAGIVLWEALVGRRLFAGQHPAAVVKAALDLEIEPPSHFDPALAPADAVVMRALERNRERRFGTALEMQRALEEAIPPATTREIGEFVQRVCKDRLAAKNDQITRMENGAKQTPRRQLGTDESPSDVEPATVADARTLVSAAPPMEDAPPKKRTRRAMWALALGLASLSIVGVTLARRSNPPTTNATSAPTSGSVPVAPAWSASASLVPLASTPSVLSSKPVTSSAPVLPTLAKVAPKPKKPKVDCANKFTVDERGIRVPIPSCF